jgi:hypothetical protein
LLCRRTSERTENRTNSQQSKNYTARVQYFDEGVHGSSRKIKEMRQKGALKRHGTMAKPDTMALLLEKKNAQMKEKLHLR